MRAFIYVGGDILPENITEKPKPEDLTIAADAGIKNAIKLSANVKLALGDFDTVSPDELPRDAEKLTYPPEKDLTDAQLAVEAAIERGADDIIIVGGLDGRLDHTLSILGILRDMKSRSIHALAVSGYNRVRLISSTSTLIPRSGYRYLSLLADSKKVKGVSIEGCKYPLKNANLVPELQYAVSNEIVENCCLISIRRGDVFVVESRDK